MHKCKDYVQTSVKACVEEVKGFTEVPEEDDDYFGMFN
jgi:hypothetical protein